MRYSSVVLFHILNHNNDFSFSIAMAPCWKCVPSHRPTFAELVAALKQF